MKYSALIEDMIAEGASAEMILVAVRAVERQEENALEKRRAADKARQAKHRNQSRDITLGNVSHAPSRSRARVEDKTLTTEIEPQEENKQTRAMRDVSEFRSELSGDLDAERLDALVKHRRSKRGQLTAHAARLFRRDAGECGLSLPEAVDTCISRNWITVKPEFLQGRARAGPTPSKVTPLDIGKRLLNEMQAANAVTDSENSGHQQAPRRLSAG